MHDSRGCTPRFKRVHTTIPGGALHSAIQEGAHEDIFGWSAFRNFFVQDIFSCSGNNVLADVKIVKSWEGIIRVFDANVEDASESFTSFCTETADDVIVFKFHGEYPQVAPLRAPIAPAAVSPTDCPSYLLQCSAWS